MDRNYYVDLRQSYLDLKLKPVRGRGCETYKSKEIKNDYKEEAKTDEEATAKEAPLPLFTHVNNIKHSMFSNVEVYINNQPIYNCNRLYAHKSYFSNNFKGAFCENKGILNCEGYDYEEFPDEIMEAPLSDPFFRRMKMLLRPDVFILNGRLSVEFFSPSQLLYSSMKIWLQLIGARTNF